MEIVKNTKLEIRGACCTHSYTVLGIQDACIISIICNAYESKIFVLEVLWRKENRLSIFFHKFYKLVIYD